MQPPKVNPCLDPSTPLGIDEACFSILNEYTVPLKFFTVIWDAYQGTGSERAILPPKSNTTVVVTTKYPLHFYYTSDSEYCHTTYRFGEHGSYGWNVSHEHLCSEVYTIHEPPKDYHPIFAALVVYILTMLIWHTSMVIIRLVKRKLSPDNTDEGLDRLQESESPPLPPIQTTKTSTRIRSVDTFRGIALLMMIFVNNGGGKYVYLNHSAWFGLTIADLVLPWFAWTMGMSITISKRAEIRATTSRCKIIARCLQRSLTLIILGLMVNSINNNSLSELRFPGVLQLLAVSYLVCATLETIFMKVHSQFGRFAIFRDILNSWPQWLIMAGIITTHTLITFLLPVPNCPTGYFGPGGIYPSYGKYINCTAGAAGYIDRLMFGNHTYGSTKDFVYGTILRHDPEGLMNTISATLIVYMGVHAGKILLLYYQCHSRVFRWLAWSAITGIIAGILCNFSRDGGVIPISKKMMTLSFDLATSSLAFLSYAVLYFLIDYKQFWDGSPFIYAGTNPIFIYVGHVLTKGLFPWAWKLTYPTHASVFLMNVWTTILWGIIAYYLYRKDIIITV